VGSSKQTVSMKAWQGGLPTWQHRVHFCTVAAFASTKTTWYVCAGFMSNRGRQNVASYLVLDMGVDWRKGADWFETVLQDYDVCSNWGNWVSAAGLTGGRINHFNITKQSKVSGCYQFLYMLASSLQDSSHRHHYRRQVLAYRLQ